MSDRYVGGLRVAAPEPSLHLSSLARLVAVTFWGGEDESTLATVGDALRPGGSYRWLGSRIGLTDDGHIATHAGLVDFHMRVGEHAQLRTAGLCAILTAEEFRLRGWMRQTMNDLLTNLPAAGYDISLLFGVDEFYQQFDYRRAWPEHRFEMDLADLVQAPDVKLEFFEHEQPDEVVALANRHEQGQTGKRRARGGLVHEAGGGSWVSVAQTEMSQVTFPCQRRAVACYRACRWSGRGPRRDTPVDAVSRSEASAPGRHCPRM